MHEYFGPEGRRPAATDSAAMASVTPLVELLDARTSDGVTMSGALAEPSIPASGIPRFDAALMMHGAAATFYDGFYRNFSAALVDRGTATLRANNRGHDLVNRGDGRGRFMGVALEAIEDCGLDIRAWLDLLESRGYRRILLFGHSLGAIKSAYYLATERDSRVTGCVLASPPRFNTERMLASERGDEFATTIAAARAEVAAGRPATFVPTTYPRREFAGAAAYLAKVRDRNALRRLRTRRGGSGPRPRADRLRGTQRSELPRPSGRIRRGAKTKGRPQL
jgi:pimeloyl-ACP methyl ester carboxylesterase